jgi:WD40 repeat protein
VELYSLEGGKIHYLRDVANHELEYHRKRISFYSPKGSKISVVRFSPDGRKIAVGDAGREIKVWDVDQELPVVTRRWLAHQSTVTTISWSPEGDRLVSGAVDGRIVVWNMNKTREIHEKAQLHPGGVFCVEWTDNNVVYSCGDDACVREVQLVM